MLNKTLMAIVLTMSATSASAQEAVRIGQPNWFAGELIANILSRVIEQEFGVETVLVPGGNAEIFSAMAAADGEIDIHSDTWMPNHAAWVDPAIEQGAIALSQANYDGVDALCVPRYVSEEFGINSVADLISERGREIFDVNADGRGDIWIGADGWGSTRVMQVKMRDYGLQDHLDGILMPEGDFQNILFERMAAREPIAFYCYQPHFWFAYDYITVLEEPAYDPTRWSLVSPDDSADWLADSEILTGDEIKDVQISYSTRLEQSHPEVAQFLSVFGVSGEAMTELIFLAQVKEIGLEFVVDDWLAANEALIATWRAAQG